MDQKKTILVVGDQAVKKLHLGKEFPVFGGQHGAEARIRRRLTERPEGLCALFLINVDNFKQTQAGLSHPKENGAFCWAITTGSLWISM